MTHTGNRTKISRRGRYGIWARASFQAAPIASNDSGGEGSSGMAAPGSPMEPELTSALSYRTSVGSKGMKKPWKCRLGWHSWVRRHDTPDPSAQVCLRCGQHTQVGGGLAGGAVPWVQVVDDQLRPARLGDRQVSLTECWPASRGDSEGGAGDQRSAELRGGRLAGDGSCSVGLR